jgi:ribonucleoside-diphosphate reductase alpha chain
MSAGRGAFMCQSQSLNIHIEDPNFGKLTSMHFYAWKKGLKTGMYYLRSRPAVDAIKFTIDHDVRMSATKIKEKAQSERDAMTCSLDDPDECVACGA